MRKFSRRIARRNVEQRVPVCVDSVSDSKGREIENKKRPLPLQEGGGVVGPCSLEYRTGRPKPKKDRPHIGT